MSAVSPSPTSGQPRRGARSAAAIHVNQACLRRTLLHRKVRKLTEGVPAENPHKADAADAAKRKPSTAVTMNRFPETFTLGVVYEHECQTETAPARDGRPRQQHRAA